MTFNAKNGSKMVPKSDKKPTSTLKTAKTEYNPDGSHFFGVFWKPRRASQGRRWRPKAGPGCNLEAPRHLQEAPRRPRTHRDDPKTPQDALRRPPRGSNTAQAAPGLPQEAPRGPQDSPETAHTAEDASKTRSRRQRLVPRRPETAQLKLRRTKSS